MLRVLCCVLIGAGSLSSAQVQSNHEMASTHSNPAAQATVQVPAMDGGAGPCSLELTVAGPDGKDKCVQVIHAYGIGGRGVELSWGIAEDATRRLLQQGLLQEKASL